MILELSFPVYCDAPLPAEHESLVFQAIASVLPNSCSYHDVEILPLSGRRLGNRLLILLPWSELTLRLPDVRLGEFLALSGSRLKIGGQVIRLGTPQVRAAMEVVIEVQHDASCSENGRPSSTHPERRSTGS